MNHIQIPFRFIKGKVTEVGKCLFFLDLNLLELESLIGIYFSWSWLHLSFAD